MGIKDWNVVLGENLFDINYQRPSLILSENENLLIKGDKFLDIGCGTGRNSVYVLSKGLKVDAIDVVPCENLNPSINFFLKKVQDFSFIDNNYNVILASRFIQYLKKDDLIKMFDSVAKSLKKDGVFLLSYAKDSWVLNKKNVEIEKFDYSIGFIVDCLSVYFSSVKIIQSKFYEPDGSGCKYTFDINAQK